MEQADIEQDAPKSVAPEKSAWAADLSSEEAIARVTAPLLSSESHSLHYRSDLQLVALLALGDASGERRYLEFVQRVMLNRNMPPGYVRPHRSELFTSITFDLYERTRDEAYVAPFLSESRKSHADAVRAYDGAVSVCRDGLFELTESTRTVDIRREWAPIVVDQIQEYVGRMAKAGWLSGAPDFYDEALSQLELFRTALRDPATGLWAHARGWFESADFVCVAKWGRGHAWIVRGLVEALTYLPPGSTWAQRVSTMLKEIAEPLVTYQDKMGFWHQVIDRPESYQETSATGMLSYYLARAVRQQFLPEEPYRAASMRALEGILKNKVSADGAVYGGSRSTLPQPRIEDYYTWETPLNDPHGVAAVILSVAGRWLLDGKGRVPETVVLRR
jgi:rhamnogalacturonyl hydrolase YesR